MTHESILSTTNLYQIILKSEAFIKVKIRDSVPNQNFEAQDYSDAKQSTLLSENILFSLIADVFSNRSVSSILDEYFRNDWRIGDLETINVKARAPGFSKFSESVRSISSYPYNQILSSRTDYFDRTLYEGVPFGAKVLIPNWTQFLRLRDIDSVTNASLTATSCAEVISVASLPNRQIETFEQASILIFGREVPRGILPGLTDPSQPLIIFTVVPRFVGQQKRLEQNLRNIGWEDAPPMARLRLGADDAHPSVIIPSKRKTS